MKNPNISKSQLRSLASSFSYDNWMWLNTQIAFLDALENQTVDDVKALADVLLTEKLNASL
jgi:hypothetical protein